MIKGISYWAMEHGLENTLPIGSALEQAKATGFEALELCIGPVGALNTQTTEDECKAIRQQIDATGVVVQTVASGMSWGFNPISNDPAVRAKAIQLHAAALERTAWLGCEAMLFVPGVVGSPIAPDEKVRYDVAIERCHAAVTELLKTADRVGVDLCIENVWNGLLLSPMELAAFVDRFESDRLGVYFDAGNLLGYHQHPPHWVELLGKRIKRVHIKDYQLNFDWQGSFDFCRLGEGQVPLAETIEALRAVGYDGTIVAEMLPYKPGVIEHTRNVMAGLLG